MLPGNQGGKYNLHSGGDFYLLSAPIWELGLAIGIIWGDGPPRAPCREDTTLGIRSSEIQLRRVIVTAITDRRKPLPSIEVHKPGRKTLHIRAGEAPPQDDTNTPNASKQNDVNSKT